MIVAAFKSVQLPELFFFPFQSIAHRGKLVEEGSHAELYEQGGIYRDLFDLQFQSGATA